MRNSKNKKQYTKPTITIHGSVEEVTQVCNFELYPELEGSLFCTKISSRGRGPADFGS